MNELLVCLLGIGITTSRENEGEGEIKCGEDRKM